ncbi:hypothetical protein RDABS01_007451 [Bienertia sinuspersici]
MERNWILPLDVVEDILSRLPIRDLLRLRCVNKEWRALIDGTSFIKNHYRVQYSLCKADSNMPCIIKQYEQYSLSREEELYFLSIHQGDVITSNLTANLERDSKAMLPYSYGIHQFFIYCHGCVNGIVCLSFIHNRSPKIRKCALALWNPATRDFKTIAYPYVPGLHFGPHFLILAFGYDVQSNDFKILGMTAIQIPGEDKSISYHAIYSLNTNSWKGLQIPLANLRRVPNATTDGSFNGVHYWTTYFSCLPMPVSNFEIVSFNFTSEAFRVSDAPQEAVTLALKGNSSYQAMIVMYKEQLGLVISHEVKEVAVYNSDIWVVTQFDDCGVPLSWQHLFTIQGSSDQLELRVDTVLINGDLLLNCASREDKIDLCDAPPRYSYHYNPSRGEFKKFQIGFLACFRYVESLFPVLRKLLEA